MNEGRVLASNTDFAYTKYKSNYIFAHPVYLQKIRVKFVYEGH